MFEPSASRRIRVMLVAVVIIGMMSSVAYVVGRDEGEVADSKVNARTAVGPTGTIWVADEEGGSLTAIDGRTGVVRTTAKGIEGPHNVQVSSDGKQVWAVSGHDSMLVGIETAHMRQIGIAPTGSHPAHVVLAADSSEAYVTASEADVVTAINLSTMRQRGSVKVGRYPHGVRPSPDGRLLLVANMKDSTLSVINRRTMRRIGDIKVGDTPVQVAWMPDSRYAFVSLNGENAVVKVDVNAMKEIDRASTDPGPAQTYVTDDGTKLLVANQGTAKRPSNTLSVIDPRTMETIATIETGKGAHGITADPTGRYAFVTNMFADEVAFVDLAKEKVVARTKVGKLPNGISFSPRAMASGVASTMHVDMGDMPMMGHGEDNDNR